MRTRILPGVFCAVALLLASCSDTDVGQPNSATSESSVSSSGAGEATSTTAYGAPSVPEPLDVQKLINRPCSALSDKQINNFPGTLKNSFTAKTTRFSDKKTSCAWRFEGDRYSLGTVGGGVPLPRDRYQGISSIYKAHKQHAYEVFQPLEIAGYPAAINNKTDNNDGDCRLSVGLRNDTVYRITAAPSSQSPDYDQPCEQAKKLASFVVENLKKAQ